MSGSRSGYSVLYFISFVLTAVPGSAFADLKHLDDSALAGISGQSGITLEMDLEATVQQLSYFDDGNGIHLEGLRLGSASDPDGRAHHIIKIDIAEDASLNLDYLVEDRRVEFGDIRLAGAPDVSMGGMFFDHSLQGTLRIASGGKVSGAGYTFDSAFTMTGGKLGYRTNGNEIFLDDVTMSVDAIGVTLDIVGGALELNAPNIVGSYQVGAIRHSNNPLNHGHSQDVVTGGLLPSYGGLAGDFDLTTKTTLQGGGRAGQGLRVDAETIINSANFIYLDDGNALTLRNITGDINVNDMRIDVTQDWRNRDALGLTVTALSGNLDIGSVELGGAGKSLGSVNAGFLFADQQRDGQLYTNALYLQGGGHTNAGPQGLRAALEWSLASADIGYTEDGNTVIVSGLQSWGRGDITVNVTRDEEHNGTRFYDGLRLGFENLKGNYRINGLRVGGREAELQGGTELLLALGFYPSYEFEMDGHITLGAGGAQGEGLTINSDIQIRNGRAALIAAPYDEGAGEVAQKGLWLTELSYDGHVRGMTVDVTDEGLAIIKGEAWSTLDVGNLRVGDKEVGASFGRLVVQKYEVGSEMNIRAGGAGNVCVGGSGADSAGCSMTGGTWEARGEEGITLNMKTILAKAVSDTKKNAFLWETGRDLDSNGLAINDTGTKLVLNDIYTSDGGDFDNDGIEDNAFGMQTDISVDVYQTRVVKKTHGPDSKGVAGSRGAEKIMDAGLPEGYRYVTNPDATDILSRPLGFAVQARAQFKELSINSIDLVHPVGGTQTAIYGVKMQNFDIKANLTATPIP